MKSSSAPAVRSPALFAPLLLALLAACGGGGSSEPEPAPPTSTPNDATCGLPDFNASTLARVNQVRAAGATCGNHGTFAPTGPLVWNALLHQAAVGHAQDMAANNYFSHVSLDGRKFSERITATGYRWTSVGENIAAGQPSVNSVVDAWVASPDHCAAMMNPAYTEVGMACVSGSASNTYRTYWTMEMGRPQ